MKTAHDYAEEVITSLEFASPGSDLEREILETAFSKLLAERDVLLKALKAIVNAWLSPLEKQSLTVQMCEDARAAIGLVEGK